MTMSDLIYEDFHEAYMGKVGIIEGTEDVVKIIAVMMPTDKSRLEPVMVLRPEFSPHDPSLAVFPSHEFRGLPLTYRYPDLSLRSV